MIYFSEFSFKYLTSLSGLSSIYCPYEKKEYSSIFLSCSRVITSALSISKRFIIITRALCTKITINYYFSNHLCLPNLSVLFTLFFSDILSRLICCLYSFWMILGLDLGANLIDKSLGLFCGFAIYLF